MIDVYTEWYSKCRVSQLELGEQTTASEESWYLCWDFKGQFHQNTSSQSKWKGEKSQRLESVICILCIWV